MPSLDLKVDSQWSLENQIRIFSLLIKWENNVNIISCETEELQYFFPRSASESEVLSATFQWLKWCERKCLLIIQGKYCINLTIMTEITFTCVCNYTSVSLPQLDTKRSLSRLFKHSTYSDHCCQFVRSQIPKSAGFYLYVILNKRCNWNLVLFYCIHTEDN